MRKSLAGTLALATLIGCAPAGYQPRTDPLDEGCGRLIADRWSAVGEALRTDDYELLADFVDQTSQLCVVDGTLMRIEVLVRARAGSLDESVYGLEHFHALYGDAMRSTVARMDGPVGEFAIWNRRDPATNPVLIALREAAQRELVFSDPARTEWPYLLAAAGEGRRLTEFLESDLATDTAFGRWYQDIFPPTGEEGVGDTKLGFGWWSPYGDLGKLGDHPAVHLEFTGGGGGRGVRIGGSVRFSDSAESIEYDLDDQLYEDRFFQALTWDFSLLQRITMDEHWGLWAVGTVGAHGHGLKPPDRDDDDPIDYRWNWQYGAGLELRRRLGEQTYLSLEARHMWHDIDPPGDEDLSGDSWWFGVGFGVLSAPFDFYWRRTVMDREIPLGP